MVDFCPKCDAIVIGKKGEETKCSSCGYVLKTKSSLNLNKKIDKKEEVEVIDKNSQAEVHPLIDTQCPKCGHKKAYYWSKQMRAGDEPETLFYKCEECSHQWRDYR